MKRILILSAAVLLAASCASMLDDIAPKHAIPSEAVTENDLNKLTNGMLYQMESYVAWAWNDGDLLAENYTGGPGFTLTDVHSETESASSETAKSRWTTAFTRINFQNEVLVSANSATSDSKAVRTAKGTAYFCRAYLYYQLVIRYGMAPILTSPTMDVVPLSDQQKVWEQIESDLKTATDYLEPFTSIYYPSDEACWALLSKVYLWMGDKTKAVEYADKVMDSSAGFAFEDTSSGYAGMFVAGTTSTEIIFALANERNSGWLRLFTAVNDTDGSWNYSIAEELRQTLFADNQHKVSDIRREPTYNSEFPTRIIKFPNGAKNMGQFIDNDNASSSPLVLLRLADVYLTKAEAQGSSDGLATMETFMDKRYESVNLPSSMTDREFQDLILDENQREFFAEGRRWFDIKRTGRTDLYKTWNGRDFLLLWPIPQDERDLAGHDNYPQNHGYSK